MLGPSKSITVSKNRAQSQPELNTFKGKISKDLPIIISKYTHAPALDYAHRDIINGSNVYGNVLL